MTTIEIGNQAAREIMTQKEGGPHLLCDWINFVFIHYEVDSGLLQKETPYALDLYQGKAYISLVAFTLEKFRLSKWEPLARWAMQPVATHRYFNVRTYVQYGSESGIYFIKEWISHPLCAFIAARMYELPCHHGNLEYQHNFSMGQLMGRIHPGNIEGQYEYRMKTFSDEKLAMVQKHSLDEFLLERYIAFVQGSHRKRYFRIWHQPWLKAEIDIQNVRDDLLFKIGRWGSSAKLIKAQYSPGVFGVWMGKSQWVDKNR